MTIPMPAIIILFFGLIIITFYVSDPHTVQRNASPFLHEFFTLISLPYVLSWYSFLHPQGLMIVVVLLIDFSAILVSPLPHLSYPL